MASFFVFIASASFVYTEQFGLSPTGFSLAFALNAIGFFGASQMAAALGERFGMARVIARRRRGLRGDHRGAPRCSRCSGSARLPVIIAMLFVGNAFLGLVMPTTMVMALDPHPDIAGLASSLGGTLQMLTGGAMIALAGPFFDGTATPMVAAIALAGAARLRRRRRLTLARERRRRAAVARAAADEAMIPHDKLDQIRGALRVPRGAAERGRGAGGPARRCRASTPS